MTEKEALFSHNEVIKEANPSLAGEIAPTLNDSAVDAFSKDDQQFLKFHGIYQQDDRDVRKQGKKFIFMIRGVNPGGVLASELYLMYDRLSEEYGNQTLRITSRQSFQFHGVVKNGLGALMKGINDALATPGSNFRIASITASGCAFAGLVTSISGTATRNRGKFSPSPFCL